MRWLFGFPGAGAGPAVFPDWKDKLAPQLQFEEIYWNSGIRRPGEYIDRMEDAAELCARRISSLVSEGDEIFLFGHCLGANAAYETAVLLSRSYDCSIRGLFVSAATSPDVPIEEGISGWDEEAFAKHIESHHTFPQEFFEKPALRKFFLPKLRADYRMIETYCDSRHAVLDCPIRGFFGDADATVPPEEIAGWASYSNRGFTLQYFPGDHYFYYDHQDEIIDMMKRMSAQFEEAA
jgi:surfactin synthase thioesterase subunit